MKLWLRLQIILVACGFCRKRSVSRMALFMVRQAEPMGGDPIVSIGMLERGTQGWP